MIKATISREKGITRAKVRGKVYDVCIETATLISDVWRGIKAKNPEAAKEYKQTLLAILLAPDSPVWEEE